MDSITPEIARQFISAPITYHVQIAPELSRMLEVYAAAESRKPETIIAEALRHYLGADQ